MQNSTGAYELDLSLVDDFHHAWREMHVKTDVFCSGAVILPDKAARILNVGGWSLTSTFVPYKRSNLAAYVSVDSDADSPTYGQMRVIDVIDEQQQGPSQVANAVRDSAEALCTAAALMIAGRPDEAVDSLNVAKQAMEGALTSAKWATTLAPSEEK